MLPQKPLAWGKSRSCIRTLAEYGAVRKREIGVENVFDFSLGNPSIPAPVSLNQAIIDLAETENESLHKYTTAAGLVELREKISEDSNRRYGLHTTADSVYVTCGAAAGLAICCKALLMPGEEVIVNAPFFPEYSVFTEAVGGKTVIVPPGRNMQLNLQGIKDAINPNTKAIIINSPNIYTYNITTYYRPKPLKKQQQKRLPQILGQPRKCDFKNLSFLIQSWTTHRTKSNRLPIRPF